MSDDWRHEPKKEWFDEDLGDGRTFRVLVDHEKGSLRMFLGEGKEEWFQGEPVISPIRFEQDNARAVFRALKRAEDAREERR